MRRLRSWLALPGAERWALLRALCAVGGVRLLLWLLPYRAVAALAHATAMPPARALPKSSAVAERIARDVERAARHVPRANCLVQALAGEWLIARAGAPVGLCFGVTYGPKGLEAHAWLVSDERVILGGEEAARFTPLMPRPAD